MSKEKSTIELLDYFAAHALLREGVSAEDAYSIALDMVKVRQDILDTVDSEMTVDSEGKLRPK